jgi:hypothetical protein
MKISNYAHTKLGYGNPKGDFWFIGPEEGGSAATLQERINVWNELGSDEHFHDLKKFHLIFKNGTERFFEGKVKLQKTWNGLIEILFGIQGKENALEAKKEYQSAQLGTTNGETLLAELFHFASKALNDSEWNELFGESKKEYWDKYASQRIQLITKQIEIYKPKIVVFYSIAFANYWEQIINQVGGKKIVHNSSDTNVSIFRSTDKTFAIIAHPVAFSMNGDIKRKIGIELTKYLKSPI